jgi:hypothetical protein
MTAPERKVLISIEGRTMALTPKQAGNVRSRLRKLARRDVGRELREAGILRGTRTNQMAGWVGEGRTRSRRRPPQDPFRRASLQREQAEERWQELTNSGNG